MKTVRPTAARSIILALGLWACGVAFAEPVTVDSLPELLPYLQQDNVEVKLAPGTYTITAADAKAGVFGSDSFEQGRKTLLLFKGSGSTYDFTGVTINVETAVFTAMGKTKIYELQVMGNRNVIKHLTLTDVGSVHDAPTVGVISVVMDGKNNRIEGMHLTTKGSAPYGYGEIFGKSPKNRLIPYRKHSAFLIRGTANHAKDCSIIHRAFGHAYVMQAAESPIIEGCYAEGEMRKTDDLLKEKGTDSEADKVNFQTTWGYRVPRGYMFCTGEAGIRAYNTGTTYIDGEVIKRGTANPTILNCTIKNLRAGCTLVHATGKKYVEGTTVLGCSQGFSIGSGDIVDCYADIQYGPALGFAYERDKGVNAEITILPHEGETVNGNGYAAFIMGHNHKITLKSQIENPDQKFQIQVGGFKNHIGGLAQKDPSLARNIQLNNQTGFRVVLGTTTENCAVQSVGRVQDRGQKNQVKQVRK